jgi:protein tyrosine phosphatase (PTP) superfamily phosphohydrolase (DUF442 family)
MASEAELLARAAMRYTHIPVPFGEPRESHFEAFRAALGAEEGPVHVHCIMNWRVSAFFYRLNRARGMNEVQARAVMEQQWSPETSENADAPAWAAFVRASSPT